MHLKLSVKKKIEIIKKYNNEAKIYDKLHFEEQINKYLLMEKIVHLNEDVCLDCGCGTGLLIKYLLNKVKFIVGVDFSLRMLEEAKKKFKNKNKVTLVLADINFLPFINNSFTKVFSFTVIDGKINSIKALKEFNRVVKHNGLTVISVLKGALTINKLKTIIKKSKFKIINEDLTDSSSKDYLFVLQK
ncbi:MAG: class I SAM-dependent methyltransferase [Candidatus Bathyarchaeia archaeon]|nr:class I SAM-dependent methyltransferase [Candidatus Bathyarchaeota archaeon]